MNITVRDVDPRTFREFKAESVRRGATLGETLTQALRLWMESRRGAGQAKRSLLDFRPFDLGPGNERLSENVDSLLYGE